MALDDLGNLYNTTRCDSSLEREIDVSEREKRDIKRDI